ncbi:thiol-disulfide isomerase/thioredoxin [Nakamurella sp. UYEF19]|uniref:TlpA family protein disulfide reductase n=1 Tax=Nakamurella sp. UYEF19 TaxID=1756392 RepID=UPI003394C5C2
MLKSGTPDRWSDDDLDRALGDLLAKSPLDPASLTRVTTRIGQTAIHIQQMSAAPLLSSAGGSQVRPETETRPVRRRPGRFNGHRTALLITAVAVAVAVAVTAPLALFHSAPALTASTGAPLSTKACATHNLTANDAQPNDTPTLAGPGASPATTWYSPAKAAQLSMALQTALPPGTCMFKGSEWGNLTFPDQLNPGDAIPQVGMLDAQAGGRLVTAAGDGNLKVSMFRAADAQSCVTGRFDRTQTEKDGTVIWQLTGSATTSTTTWIVLVVTAFQKNGTCSMLRVSDERVGADDTPSRPGMSATGAPPLSLAQLTTLATTPGLTIAPFSDIVTGAALFTYAPQTGKTEFSYPTGERRPLPTLTGPALTGSKTLATSDYPGKILVINFWGSWCSPCRDEADELRLASAALDPDHVQFLGINVKDNTSGAIAFNATSRITYPSIFDPTDLSWQAISGESAGSLPVTIVLDRQHRVAHVWLHEITHADLGTVVGTLLKEK